MQNIETGSESSGSTCVSCILPNIVDVSLAVYGNSMVLADSKTL